MTIVSNEKLEEAFSLAVEDRSSGMQDLVSDANVITVKMKELNQFTEYSGPRIRERLQYQQSGTYTRADEADFLATTRRPIIADAEWEPKAAFVSPTLSGKEIRATTGRAELKNRMTTHIDAAEQELIDNFTVDLHSAGSLSNQIEGLQKAIPTDGTTGTYGGINRANVAVWQTATYDIDTYSWPSTATQFTSATAQMIMREVVIKRSRGKRGPSDIYMTDSHFAAYSDAVEEIQRINDETGVGRLGFLGLRFYGAGKSLDVILEGGIGTAMPAATSYFIDRKTLKFRVHPDLNFSKLGGPRKPVNQDIIVQHIGFEGNLTMLNSLFNAKLYDSDTAS